MKTGYIISALATLCALAIGCTKMTVGGDLAEVQLSQSTVTLPAKGGSAKIDVNATGEWTIKALTDAEAKWLAVDKMSGPAGTTSVTFTALAESAACNKTTLILTCAGAEQHIYVQQGVPSVSEVTCKEVNEGPKGATYRVTGICTAIAESATYGNWYITDDESDPLGTVYIYGTKYNGQTKQGAIGKYNIEVGDQVTIEGPKDVYNGTVELVDVDIIKVVKSLCKVCNSPVKAPKDGGNVDLKVIAKGGNLNIVPKVDWIKIASTGMIKKQGKDPVDTTLVTLVVNPNEGGVRDGEVELTSGTSTVTAIVSQEGAINYVSIASIFEGGVGVYSVKDAVVMAKASGNVIISDGTANMMVYKSGNDLEPGDVITLNNQKVSERSGLLQFGDSAIEWIKGEKTEPVYGRVVEVMTDADVIGWSGNPQYQYIHFVGTMGSDNRTIKCGEKGIYVVKTEGFAGEKVEVWGYANGAMSTFGTITTTLVKIQKYTEPEPISYSTLAQVFAGGVGTYSVKDLTVMTVSGSNVILGDGTNNIMLYKSGNDLKAGDIVTINNGAVSLYNNLLQFNGADYLKSARTVTPDYGTPVEIKTDADITGWGGNPQYQYIHCVGTMGTDNRTIKCGEKGIYIAKTAGFAGEKVEVWGYANGVMSSYGTITTTLVKIQKEEN